MDKIDTPFPVIKKGKKKAKAVRFVFKTVLYALAVFGFLMFLLTFSLIGLLKGDDLSSKQNILNGEGVLFVDFDEFYPETREDTLMTDFTGLPSVSLFDLQMAIGNASVDPNIKAIVGKIGNSPMGLAQIQEIRRIIKIFRNSGKKAYLFSQGMGMLGGGTNEYYLAAAFDEIWMQPHTQLGITGFLLEFPYAKELFDKIGVKPQFYSRYEYKSAMAMFTQKGISQPQLQNTALLADNLSAQFLYDVSQDRKIEEKDMAEIINNAPVSAEEAQKKGLIDYLAYWTDMKEQLKLRYKVDEFLTPVEYLSTIQKKKSQNAIAYMVIEGTINGGLSVYNPMNGELVAGSESVNEYVEKIKQNKRVKAVVVRIDSPGGSYDAANEMWYALKKLKMERNIPVIVSQGNYAASGGYFVSLAGDYIFSEASSVTGSIGVLGGKFILEELWKKLGVRWHMFVYGKNAGIDSSVKSFSPEEEKIFNRSLDLVYEDFTKKVAEARHLTVEEVDAAARGRVWTGNYAKKMKLVDEIGGINEAFLKAKSLAGIKGSDFEVIYYPEPKSWAEKLDDFMRGTPKIQMKSEEGVAHRIREELNPWLRLQYNAVLPPLKIEM